MRLLRTSFCMFEPKPEARMTYTLDIIWLINTICGQAHEHHRAYLESLPATSYPLKPLGDSAEVNETQRVTEGGWEQR